MQVGEIVDRVRSAIDEQMANDSGFLSSSSDEENLTTTIIDKIGYALLHVIENAPEEKLDNDMLQTVPTTGVLVQANKCVRVQLPADLLRIVSARLSSWSLSPVPISEYSQEYLMQQDDYAKGSWDRPVNAIVYSGTNRYLEMYCAKTDQDTISISCIKKPTIPTRATMISTPTTNVSIPSRLEAAFIYQVAGLSMVAFREEVATALFGIAQKYLQNNQEDK